jgi:hypothetical protein
MNDLDDRIALAERHVVAGRRIVARQRERIARGEVFGTAALDLLAAFEQTQEIFEADLLRLLDLRPPPDLLALA